LIPGHPLGKTVEVEVIIKEVNEETAIVTVAVVE
jgi:hypothetical protein